MNNKARQITESILNTNLNELAHSLIRELTMACRKMAIYGANHPTAKRSVEKPFFAFDKIFQFKRYININASRGLLYVMNIRLRESVFTEEILKYMQMLEIEALLFERRMTMTELSLFLDRFVKRVNRTDYSNLLGTYLKEHNIDTIEVNTQHAMELFEQGLQYRGDLEGDYSVKTMAMKQFGDNLELLADILSRKEEALREYNIDFTNDLVLYLIPEKVASIPPAQVTQTLTAVLEKLSSCDEQSKEHDSLTEQYQSLWKLLDYHPDRQAIIDNLQQSSESERIIAAVADKVGDKVTAIRFESGCQVDMILETCFGENAGECDIDMFSDAFHRLLRTGQHGKAFDTISTLLDYLNKPDAGIRNRALDLLLSGLRFIELGTDELVFTKVLNKTCAVLEKHEETFEYSEFIWRLWEKCLVHKRYDLLVQLASAIQYARKTVDDVTIYESVAIKKVLEYINRSEVIAMMIDELMHNDKKTAGYIQNIFIATGGEEVALGLSNIISHPDRHIRQMALKILSELGKASLKVCTRILVDDSMFERDSGRHELPDAKWYIIRNAIFVLGKLKDPEGVMPLRLRISDKDVRVRREIVSALEKIGGEDACDMLILMTDDPVKEIRESAMIAVGLIGTSDTAPLVIDVISRNPHIALKGVSALGKLGGELACEYLGYLLENRKEFEKLAGDVVPKDELRLAIIKALGSIGDKPAIEKIKEFKDSLSTTQKLFFKNSAIHKTVNEILARN